MLGHVIHLILWVARDLNEENFVQNLLNNSTSLTLSISAIKGAFHFRPNRP